MSEERDTLFQGVAKLLWDEIEDKIIVVGDSSKESLFARHSHPLPPAMSREVDLLIAQRAYDLVIHALTRLDLPEYINDIPDITEWPEE